jgi:biopolymer transport protein ExbB
MLLQTPTTMLTWDEALRLQSWGFWLLPCVAVLILFLFWEKFWALANGTRLPTKLLENIKPLIRIGDKATSLQLCNNHKTPSAKLLAVGVGKLGKPFREIHDTLQQAIQLQMNEYAQRLGYLMLLAEITPAIGLFIALMQTQFLSMPFQFAHLLPLWLGWIWGFLANIGYNVLVMRLHAIKYALDKTMHLWLMFLQEN